MVMLSRSGLKRSSVLVGRQRDLCEDGAVVQELTQHPLADDQASLDQPRPALARGSVVEVLSILSSGQVGETSGHCSSGIPHAAAINLCQLSV